jgi:hypothetical protein
MIGSKIAVVSTWEGSKPLWSASGLEDTSFSEITVILVATYTSFQTIMSPLNLL